MNKIYNPELRLWWSDTVGWVDVSLSDSYSDIQKTTLPIGGMWVSFGNENVKINKIGDHIINDVKVNFYQVEETGAIFGIQDGVDTFFSPFDFGIEFNENSSLH